MQTALIQFKSNIQRVKDLDGLYRALQAQTGGLLDLSDLLRTVIVMGVSALDLYMHEVTRLGMIEALNGTRTQTDAFRRFQAPLEHVIRGFSVPGSSGWLDDAIRQAHGWRSFQLPDKIAEAIRLISPISLWDELARRRGVSTRDLKNDVSAIVERRNKIVHEADLDPSFPATQWPISQPDAQHATSLIEWTVETMHTLIS